MRRGIFILSGALVLTLASLGSFFLGRHTASKAASPATAGANNSEPVSPGSNFVSPTMIYAHNLLLQKGPHFRIYIRWIRGQMLRTHPQVDPSFDAPESFLLEIQKGVLSVHLQDLTNLLNAGTVGNVSLKNVSIQVSGNQVELHGTAHKIVPLPVKIVGVLSPLPDGRILFHVLSFSLLKIPLKGLLGTFHMTLSSVLPANQTAGIEVDGNDIRFDTQTLLPPPHIHGQITAIAVSPAEIKVVYGNAGDDENRLSQWHNFLRFRGGSLDFGKLTMRDVDLTMIDASQDPWFDLDLVNYQAQVVNGYTRMTAQAGLEIYMPDLDEIPLKKASQGITLEWLKNRRSSLPSDVPAH